METRAWRVIKFLLDEHVHPAVAKGLRLRGIDVLSSADAGLLGESDEHYLERAILESRVVVTHDDDFLKSHAAGKRHAGIAYCHQSARTVGEIVSELVLLSECLTPDEMNGRVEFL